MLYFITNFMSYLLVCEVFSLQLFFLERSCHSYLFICTVLRVPSDSNSFKSNITTCNRRSYRFFMYLEFIFYMFFFSICFWFHVFVRIKGSLSIHFLSKSARIYKERFVVRNIYRRINRGRNPFKQISVWL